MTEQRKQLLDEFFQLGDKQALSKEKIFYLGHEVASISDDNLRTMIDMKKLEENDD